MKKLHQYCIRPIGNCFYVFLCVQGKDFRSQFQMGNGAFYGLNYIQVK